MPDGANCVQLISAACSYLFRQIKNIYIYIYIFLGGGVQAQAAAAALPEEVVTHPGPFPGVYGCDTANLASIYLATAEARLAVAEGDLQTAEVGSSG
jgi:hypothetical protein